MSSFLDNEFPIVRMNTDDEDRNVPQGEYRFALNVRNGTPYVKKGGTATNVKGNVLVPVILCPYSGSFPAGRNKTIGSYEDTINNSIIFLNWNSNGNHGIYRWYKDKTDANNPNGIIEQVIVYNFGWKQNERITSISYVVSTTGDLLYWCDSTGLRKINLDRANINGKSKSWKFYFPKTNPFFQASNFRVRFSDINNNLVVLVNIVVGAYQTREDGITAIATAINSNPAYNTKLVADACGCELIITEKGSSVFNYQYQGAYINLPLPPTPFPCIMASDNWYGINLTDRMFDRAMYPPMNAPQTEYRKDPNTLFNNVSNKVFQFRLEYGYFDFERSILGVYSQIPLGNLQCDGTTNLAFNYINVNFNDTQIPVETTLIILKDVALVAREGNTGTDREIIRLTPCDFLEYNYVTNTWFCEYDFYNNIISSPTLNNPERLESGVPILANAEVFDRNRMVEGGVVLGRDGVDCVEADYKIKIAENPQPELYSITGIIRIFNPLMDENQNYPDENTQPNILERRSAIIYDSTINPNPDSPTYPCFGGSYFKNGTYQIDADWAYNKKRQLLPEGGWAAYCAGTPYFSVSKQIQREGVSQRSDGSIDVGSTAAKDELRDLYEDFNPNDGFPPSADIYSTFSILVPPGEYIVRLASHWCSFGDKLQKGFMYDLNGQAYQQTSTYVWGVTPFQQPYKNAYEIKVTVTNSDIFIGEFLVSDLALDIETIYPLTSTGVAPSVSGYLFDNNGLVDAENLKKGLTVELSKTEILAVPGDTPAKIRPYMRKITDHNGFYFCYGLRIIGYTNKPQSTQVSGIIHSTSAPVYYEDVNGLSALALLFDGTITQTFPRSPIPSHIEEIIPTDTPNARLLSSTFIQGTVTDNNSPPLPIPNVKIVYQRGRVATSNDAGNFSLLAWADYQANTNNRITDYLIFNGQIFCNPTYPNGQQILILITSFGNNPSTVPPPYSPTAVYKIGNFTIIELNNPSQKARKRGGSYIDVIRYYDEQGRLCSCQKLYEVYVPFETEDLGQYPQVIDNNNNPYPLGTYRGGKPTIQWSINFNPPQYAAFYQLMRSKNLFYGRYLQWVVDEVVYLSAVQTESTPEIETSFQNQNAVAVKLSLNNTISYAANNPGSLVGYTYQQGDRVRLIYDRNLNLVQGLQDFEITSFDAQTQSIVVKNVLGTVQIQSGFVIEIYNPKSVNSEETQIFYECGEVYKCTAPNTPNNQHSVTSGVFTNGDTYWHGRNILVNDDRDNFGANYPVVIESSSISDFYPSESQDIGRIGIIDENLKQIYYPSRLIVSDQFQQDSAFNGLSSFSALNTKDEGRQYGEVSRLVMRGKILHAIMKNNNIANYVGVVTFQYAQSTQGVQAIADDFLGTENPSISNIGTEFPASVVQKDGYIYGLMSLRKNFWRYTDNGMTEISRNTYQAQDGSYRTRMVNYFRELCSNGLWDAVGVYDRRYGETIITAWEKVTKNGFKFAEIFTQQFGGLNIIRFNEILNLSAGEVVEVTYTDSETGAKITEFVTLVQVDFIDLPNVPPITNIRFVVSKSIALNAQVVINYKGEGKTIAWNEEKDGWTTEYSFVPECYGSLGDEIVSFKDGRLWLHDKNTLFNNFYGTQYNLKIYPVFNQESSLVKVWNALWCMFYQDNNQNNFFANRIYNNNGQLSRLRKTSFQKREEFWFSSFARDITDTTVTNPILNGRNLRSTSLTVELENDYNGEINIFGFRANWTPSERTTK